MKKGVFWIIDGELYSFPFDSTQTNGIAKSGDTYNHKKLWEFVKPKGCNKPYNHYPRGRVEVTNKGKPLIYMNPSIDLAFVKHIKNDFEIVTDVYVRYDFSEHYRCCLDVSEKEN